MRRILPLAIALTALAAPAAHASKLHYKVTRATGFERVEFNGTPASGCQAQNTCGVSGTVTYSLSGTPRHTDATVTHERGKVTDIAASFRTRGHTQAAVNVPGRAACSASASHSSDAFTLGKPRAGLLRFLFHDGSPDYLKTDCPTPAESALAKIGALPSARFKQGGFDHPNFHFSLFGSRNFLTRGYEGSVTWQLKFALESR